MPKILSDERVIEYSMEFKIRVVRLTFELDTKAIDIAKVLSSSSVSAPVLTAAHGFESIARLKPKI